MKLKMIALVTVLIFSLIFMAACQSSSLDDSSNNDPSVLYKSDKVEVSLIENIDTNKISYYEWAVLTKDDAFTENTVIVTGTVSNVRQAAVAYEFMDVDVVDNITIFDVEVSDVLACRSGSYRQGDLITMGIGYNMNTYSDELPVIEEGKTYLIFCYVAADDKDDVMELAGYVDCWISAPKDLFLEKVGDFYLLTDGFFSDVPGSFKLTDRLSLTEEQINALSNVNSDKADYICSYINEKINTNNVKGVTEALLALKIKSRRTVRSMSWRLTKRSYLISCDELEEYLRNTSLLYGG